jgi:hypothetical protein
LVEAKSMRQADGDGFVVLKSLVIGSDCAVHQGQDQALQSDHSIVHENGIKGPLPLQLTSGDLFEIGIIGGESGNAEEEIELCELVVVFDLFRIGDELLVYFEERRLVDHGE